MTTDEKKNIAIAVLAGALGMALIVLGYWRFSGGPDRGSAPSPSTTSTASTPSSASASSPAPTPPPQPAPAPALAAAPAPTAAAAAPDEEYDWVQSKKQEFVLDSGAGRVYGPIMTTHAVRYDLKASQAVNTGVMGWQGFKPPSDVATMFQQFDTMGSTVTRCYQAKALQIEQTCPFLTKPETAGTAFILVRDTRRPGGPGVMEAAGAYLGAKDPLKKATAENRVKLTVYDWKCVRYCKDQQ